MVKIDSNVAYISNEYADNLVRKMAKQTRASAKPKAVPKKAEQPKKGLVSTLAVAFIAFCALAVLVSRYAVACSVGKQNNDLQQGIAAVEDRIDALQVDLELRDDITIVQQTARQELGMTYPDQDQIVEITP